MKYYRSLTDLLQRHFSIHQARLKFIARFTLALLMQSTVSFPKLALVLSRGAKPASNERRIQRFMSGYALDFSSFGRFLLQLVPQSEDFVVSMDRTNWKFGRTDINVLMIAICYKGIAYPVLWQLLPKAGNSNTAERKALMERFLRLVPAEKIKAFLADREFIGEEWLRFLRDRDVPFCIRVKKDTTVEAGSGTWGPAWWLFKDVPVMGSVNGRTGTHGTIRALSKECRVSRLEGLHLVGTRYVGREGKAEYLLILTNSDPEEAIDRYRRRWEIETLFGALKSRGFDLEATHLRAPGRIRKLIALLSLAFVWAHLVGLWRQEREGPLRRKNHGRLEKSVFRYGLDHLRRLLLLAGTAEEAFERCLRLLREPQRVLSGT